MSARPLGAAQHIPRPAVVVLWATWCASCKAELDRLPALIAAARPLPVVTLAIDPPDLARARMTADHRSLASAFADGRNPMTVLADWGGKGAVLPLAVALDRSGKVCGMKRGPLGTDQLEQWARMLEVSDLVAGYRGRPIARLPALSVGPAQAALLGGPSGSGKPTLLLAIAGLADRFDGAITVAGENVGVLGPRKRDRHRGRHIGMIFQDLHLIPGLTALDNLMLAPFANGGRTDRAAGRAMLDRLGVSNRAHARAETLSRGEAQRSAIARAMLVSPQLILAEEPTASLDDEACDAVLDLLFEATQQTGATLVIASHDARVRQRVPHGAVAEPA